MSFSFEDIEGFQVVLVGRQFKKNLSNRINSTNGDHFFDVAILQIAIFNTWKDIFFINNVEITTHILFSITLN